MADVTTIVANGTSLSIKDSTARNTASSAYTQANNAYTQANNAYTKANTASTTATTANSVAQNAVSYTSQSPTSAKQNQALTNLGLDSSLKGVAFTVVGNVSV